MCLVVHEGAHGIVGVMEKIGIKTGGFAIFIAMFAGFVEPDEEQFSKAKKISRLRLIGAGPTSNVIFAFALGAILFTNPMFAMIVPEPFFIILYLEMVFAAFLKIEFEKHSEHRLSPLYFLLYTAVFSHF